MIGRHLLNPAEGTLVSALFPRSQAAARCALELGLPSRRVVPPPKSRGLASTPEKNLILIPLHTRNNRQADRTIKPPRTSAKSMTCFETEQVYAR